MIRTNWNHDEVAKPNWLHAILMLDNFTSKTNIEGTDATYHMFMKDLSDMTWDEMRKIYK